MLLLSNIIHPLPTFSHLLFIINSMFSLLIFLLIIILFSPLFYNFIFPLLYTLISLFFYLFIFLYFWFFCIPPPPLTINLQFSLLFYTYFSTNKRLFCLPNFFFFIFWWNVLFFLHLYFG